MEKMIAAERQKEIIRLLNKNGSVKINELSELFNVSKETVRRDISYLNEIGEIKKTHGGATSTHTLDNIPIQERIEIRSSLKTKLCQAALQFIPQNGVIYLDNGSTIFHLAKLLAKQSGHTIVTASISAANALIGSNNTAIISGGQLNGSNNSVEGFQTTSFFNSIKVAVAFLGTNGFEEHNGPAVSAFADAQTKQAIVPNSKINIVISDSTKASTSALVQYASWRDIDYFITDSNLPGELYDFISQTTKIILVDE